MKKTLLHAISTLIVVLLLGTGVSFADNEHLKTHRKLFHDLSSEEAVASSSLSPDTVCMVTDKYLVKKQIPVNVNDETYYGCCQGCVGRIHNDVKIRFSVDPFSGEKVDKAKAYIALKPSSKSDVLYFKSKENYAKYVKKSQR